jgi:hypothetical protein
MRRRTRVPIQGTQLAFDFDSFCLVHDIGKSTGRQEIKSGRLRAKKVGRRTIITAEDAAAWRAAPPVAEQQSDT